MKCDNCGKEEVNYQFTANINGDITEKNLCADCAANLGYMDRSQSKPEASFEDIFMDLFGARPNRRMLTGFGMVIPTFIVPTIGVFMPGTDFAENSSDNETQPEPVPAGIKPELDAEMQKRREINILREQMRQAAETENYEKAAALRDSIKKLESVENL